MNSAYGNSPLRCELTRNDPRPPGGGIYRVGITQRRCWVIPTASLCIVSLLSHERFTRKKGSERIAHTFQRWLLACIVIAYLVTSTFTFSSVIPMSFPLPKPKMSITATMTIAASKTPKFKAGKALKDVVNA